MTADNTTAFDSLDARAQAQGSTLDRISLRDHVVKVEIGAFQVERGMTQRVSFDVVVEVMPPQQPLGDDVDRILSYDVLVQAIATELAAERLNLLETLAERIADRILGAPQAVCVFLRIQKLDLGPGALGVEIVRRKTGAPLANMAGVQMLTSPPQVVYLSNAAIACAQLANWLDQLHATGIPVVLCVGPADNGAPVSAAPHAQRRIDLLEIDQNAWVLAALDPRCLVVNTWAEFDWAARNNQISVWAPSKIVLDTVEGPDTTPADAIQLMYWFAHQQNAQRLILIDAPVPGESELSVTAITLDQNIPE